MDYKAEIIYDAPLVHMTWLELRDGSRWKLEGECSRCGKCCEHSHQKEPCVHLGYENFNGKRIAKCAVYGTRPLGCAISPNDPHEKLKEGCTYIWKRIS